MTMYQACLLHARADRHLRGLVSAHLEQFKITRMEWLLLAACNSAPYGEGMSALARVLDVSLPQITALAMSLVDAGLIQQSTDRQDKRARIITITSKGQELIVAIEKSMRGALREWLAFIPRPQLEVYMHTVQLLADQ